MSRVITFSTKFPAHHPRKGEPTEFVEKIWSGLIELRLLSLSRCCEFSDNTNIAELSLYNIRQWHPAPKYHTIRVGHRWKVGDRFSPRIWSGKPYNSKQIIIAPDIEVKKVWYVAMTNNGLAMLTKVENDEIFVSHMDIKLIEMIAKNDGLELFDLINWFNKPMIGQIICWNENINY